MSDLIPPDQLHISSYPDRRPGGQHVVDSPSGVRVEHIETGLVAWCATARSQRLNREIAVHMIEAALTHPRFLR